MSRRSLIWCGLAALLVVLLVFGAGFQLTTQRALENAEALRLRRLLVAEQEDDGLLRFFYATNRRNESGDGSPLERLGTEREARLEFGRFDTSISPSLGIGMLIDPTDWFQNEEIQLRDVRAVDEASFVSELREQVERSTHRSLLVNVNGFRERFGSALRKTAFLGYVLDIDSPLVVFDWPGDQGSSLRGYRRAQAVAAESGEELARLLRTIVLEIQPERLWLTANSMGAEVVVSAFTRLLQDPELSDAEHEIEHVILTAPDVDAAEFGARFRDEIQALTDHLTVYVSSNDRALLVSRILNRGHRLGESRIDIDNPDTSEETLRALELIERDSDVVELVDVTPVNRTRNFHNFSLETPEFFDDLFLRLVNDENPSSRRRYLIRTRDGQHYWVLTRGR